MMSFLPQLLSTPNSFLSKGSPAYFRPRPQDMINYSLIALTLDLGVTIVALILADSLLDTQLFGPTNVSTGVVLVALTLILWLVAFLFLSVYPADQLHSLGKEMWRAASAILVASCILLGILSLTGFVIPRGFFALNLTLNLILVIGWRLLTNVFFQTVALNRSAWRTLLIGVNDLSLRFAEKVAQNPKSQITICGFIDDVEAPAMGYPILGSLTDDLQRIIEQNQIDSMVIALPYERDSAFSTLLQRLRMLPVRLHVLPEYFDLGSSNPSLEAADSLFLTDVPRVGISMRERMLKRLFDIVVVSIGLFLVLPTAVLVAIAIKLDSPGPIFFKQLRVGEYGRRFYMYKFRSMVPNAEQLQNQVNVTDGSGNLIHKRPNDPRVTRVGRIIRKLSVDELPQLINVLLGDMSLVGPRPEMPWVVNRYEPWQYQRFVVPPGMTGWWQINGRSEEQPMHLGTQDDLYYIENYSFLLDIKILLLTIPVVLSGKGSF